MQEKAWEREYRSELMLKPSNVPQADVVRFAKWLKKRSRDEGNEFDFEKLSVLDLGSGTGKNAFYFAERGANAIGYEISDTAISHARKFAHDAGFTIEYRKLDIGGIYPLPDTSIDIILDITSSNSLSQSARQVYLSQMHRTLKEDGIVMVRALSYEGDKHAKELVERFPGNEPDTYVHPDLGITETVFTRESFTGTYEPFFIITKLERVEHYVTVSGRKYKRQYWIAYLNKK